MTSEASMSTFSHSWTRTDHRPDGLLGSDHGPVVLNIPLAVAEKERITRLAHSYAQGRLHAIRPNSPGVREAAAAVLQKACEDRTLPLWLLSGQDTATMGTPEVQAVFDLLYAFRDDGSEGDSGAHAVRHGPVASVWTGGDGGISGSGPLGSAGLGTARP